MATRVRAVPLRKPPSKGTSRKRLLKMCRQLGLPVNAATENSVMRRMLSGGMDPKVIIRKWARVVTASSRDDALKLVPASVMAQTIRNVRFTKMSARGEHNKAWLVIEYEVPVGR
jgi:hypothetical protein